MQNNTSKNTSVNSKRLPRIYKAFGIHGNIFDYGCGKYTDHIRKSVEDVGFQWFGYDPYNQDGETNDSAKSMIQTCDYIFCSNVLNVIDDDASLKATLHELIKMCKSKIGVVSVYEGNKTGVGVVTKPDCYQRNQPLAYYVNLIKQMGVNNISTKKGCIVINGN